MNTNAKVFSLGLDMLRSWALLLCFVTIPAFSQTVIGPGKVSGTWTAQNSPYIIQGFISVEENQTLVIKPGTVVKFDSYSLRVDEGESLVAEGTPDSMIIFTSNKANPAPGDWGAIQGGIMLDDLGDKAVLKYCIVEYATSGIACFASAYGCTGHSNRARIENCILRFNKDHGIYCLGSGGSTGCIPSKTGNSSPHIESNWIYENGGAGIFLVAWDGDYANGYIGAEIFRNVISNNQGYGIQCYGDDPVQPKIANNTIANNVAGGIRFLDNFDPKHFLIRNNIIADNGIGLHSVNAAIPTHQYNDLWSNSTDYQGLTTAVGDTSADPLFVNANARDFHLQSLSPCIDAGDPVSPKDPDSTIADMGAFYFHQVLPPVADFIATPTTGAFPLTVQFTNKSFREITGYFWDFGDSLTSTEQNPAHTYQKIDTFTVKLTVSGPAGSDTLLRPNYITVKPPPAPSARFEVTPSSGTAPLTVQFTDRSTGQINTRLWEFGDGQTSTESNTSHLYSDGGTYTAKLTVTGLGGTSFTTATIRIKYAVPVADFIAFPRNGVAPLTVQFTDSARGNVTLYRWEFGDGYAAVGKNPSHIYQNAGVYSVQLKVSGPGGEHTAIKNDYITVTPSGTYFTDRNLTLMPLRNGSACWGDYDSDGDLDVLLTGERDNTYHALIYKNNGNDTFTNLNAVLSPVAYGNTSWGDYDNDGDLDVLISGWNGTQDVLKVYRNDGSDKFNALSQSFKTVSYREAEWFDYDTDGDLDIMVTGAENNNPVAYLYVNNRNDSFALLALNLPTLLYDGSITVGDSDNDGDVDLLLTGLKGTQAYSILYRNDGSGRFTNANANLRGVYSISAAQFGDCDNDGDLDLLLAGSEYGGGRYAGIYRNDGNNVFRDLNANLLGQRQGSVSWGDYDNDGDLDAIVSGESTLGDHVRLYRNEGGNRFTLASDNFAHAVGACQWGDYDNDGDLDLLLAGRDGNVATDIHAKIYRNENSPPNHKPAAPANLKSSMASGVLTLSWDAASDSETPAKGLYYNLRLGTTREGNDLMTAHSTRSGVLTVPSFGNVQQNKRWSVHGLNPNLAYYWSVQALDGCFAGSEWASAEIVSAVGDDHSEGPAQFSLQQNYPNPFNPTTKIGFTLAEPAHVRLSLHDLTGKEIKVLLNEKRGAGAHEVAWDGRDAAGHQVASGVYFYTIRSQSFVETKKMILTQ